MKRISIALICILGLACSANAQILNTFTEVIKQARNDLNVDTADTDYLPAREGNARIRSGMSLVNRLLGDNRTNTAVVTAVNTYKYGLPDSLTGTPDTVVLAHSSITSVQWISADSNKTLIYVPRNLWSEQEHKQTKGQINWLAHPSNYDFYDDTIYLNPIPSMVDTIYVTTIDNIYGLDTVTTLAKIHEDYRDAILKRVVYLTARARQHPLLQDYKDDYLTVWLSLFPNFRPQVQGAQ